MAQGLHTAINWFNTTHTNILPIPQNIFLNPSPPLLIYGTGLPKRTLQKVLILICNTAKLNLNNVYEPYRYNYLLCNCCS
jgi:subtilase family serine protease